MAIHLERAGAVAVAEHPAVHLGAEAAHLGALVFGGERRWRVDHGHGEGLVAEQGGNRVKAHSAVDGLGGERVAVLVPRRPAGVGMMPTGRVLLVDDDADVRELLHLRLEQLAYTVSTAANGTQALEKLAAEHPSLVLLDLKLPRLSGLEVLRHIKQEAPDTTVVVMTAYATVEKAVEAMKEGAYDFLTKPLTPGHLELVVQKAFERQALQRAERLLQEEIDWKTQPIVGESPAIRQAVERARRAAASPSTVLLLGESGTGKEVSPARCTPGAAPGPPLRRRQLRRPLGRAGGQ